MRPPEPGEIRRKLRWIAVWPFGLIGGLVGPVLMSPLLRARNSAHCDCSCDVAVPAWELIAYGVVTAAMTMAAIALALRKESATDTRAVTLLAVFGWLNCPACLVVWTLVTEHDAGLESLGISLFVATFFGTLIGIFVALPLSVPQNRRFDGLDLAGLDRVNLTLALQFFARMIDSPGIAELQADERFHEISKRFRAARRKG